jgi:hypothetical protein
VVIDAPEVIFTTVSVTNSRSGTSRVVKDASSRIKIPPSRALSSKNASWNSASVETTLPTSTEKALLAVPESLVYVAVIVTLFLKEEVGIVTTPLVLIVAPAPDTDQVPSVALEKSPETSYVWLPLP